MQAPAPVTVTVDTLRAALDATFSDAKYGWEQPPDPFMWWREAWRGLLRWLDALHGEQPILYLFLLIVLTALLVMILAYFARITLAALSRDEAIRSGAEPMANSPHSAEWFRREARRLEAQGMLLESLTHRFAALLMDLEVRRVLRVHPAKTPLEYASEAALDEDGRGAFTRLVRDYYRHLFGGTPVTRSALEAFDSHASGLVDHASTA